MEDPEALTHYLGNDEYKNGNNVSEEPSEKETHPDGYSAEGNYLIEIEEWDVELDWSSLAR